MTERLKWGARHWFKTTVVLASLAASTMVCAYVGWARRGVGYDDAVFLSLEALKLGSEYRNATDWQSDRWLQAARFLGLAFYLVTALKAFALLLRTQVDELAVQLTRRDLVCIGDHPVLGDIAAAAARHGRHALWVGPGPHHVLPRHARRVRRPWDASMVAQFRLRSARTCVIAFTDDIVAIEAAFAAARRVSSEIIVLPAGFETADALLALSPRPGIRIVPIPRPVARALHRSHPPFLVPRAAGQDGLEVLIVGDGAMAEAMMIDLLLSSLTSELARPRITFVASDPDRMVADFAMRFPELGQSVSLHFLSAADGLYAALAGWDAVVTNAYVCLDDERQSLAAGGILNRAATERGWPVATIFVQQRSGSGLHEYNHMGDRRTARLVPFGAAATLASDLGLLDPQHDAQARHLHAAYRVFAASATADCDWEMLPQDARDANRNHAAHLPAKLASAGVSLAAWAEQPAADRTDTPLPRLPDLDADPALLERLARLEHERWMVDRRLGGWRYGPHRDDAARRHPDLVPYDALSQRSKDYDAAILRALARSPVWSD